MTALFRLTIVFIIIISNISCVDRFYKHGYIPNEDKISKVRVSSTNKDILNSLLGAPALLTVQDGQENWYYMSTKKQSVAFLKPVIIENNIIKIGVTRSIVTSVDKYDINDMNKIIFVKETTGSNKAELGILKQILGNAGRFSQTNDF